LWNTCPDQNADGPADQGEHHGFSKNCKRTSARRAPNGFAHANFLGALGHRDEHDVHHPDAAHQQAIELMTVGENHQRASELVPQVAEEVRRASLESFPSQRGCGAGGGNACITSPCAVSTLTFSGTVNAMTVPWFRLPLLEVAERVTQMSTPAEEQSLVVLKYADNFVKRRH